MIIYLDDHIVAINKPTGLLVHRSAIDRGERRFAVQEVRNEVGRHVYPVHRLDKPTSGVLVFGLSPEAAERLSTQFLERRVTKSYLAVVRGYVGEPLTIDYALKPMQDFKGKDSANKEAQESVTDCEPLAITEIPHAVNRYPTSRYSLVALHPKTGRKHQLRRHMKHIFHPIIGDTRHGDWRHNKFFASYYGCGRLLLHAASLRFQHPTLDSPITIHAPLDEIFQQLLFDLFRRS